MSWGIKPGENVRDYYRAMGRLQEQLLILERLEKNVCDSCDHASCNDLKEIIQEIMDRD